MSDEEIREFLTSEARSGKLAVVRKDGHPSVSPIWFGLDDDGTLVFTSWHESVKVRAMRRDPRISICVDRDEPPFDYVRVDGTAEVIDDRELVRHWATRLGGRYMGADRAEEFGARNGVPGELFVRVRITRAVGLAEVAGW